jgi:BirA family biotin operon repressor/biotin-[acetyl-CoA-carboxylase] ligase
MQIRDKKVSGILIENSLAGDAIQYSIVGIGLNVNQETFSLPAASSMKIMTGIDFSLADLLCSLLEFLEQRYLQLRSGKTLELRNDYLKSLYGIGEPRNFADAEGEWQGTIEGVTQHGKLLILKQGFIKSYDMKEIRFIS